VQSKNKRAVSLSREDKNILKSFGDRIRDVREKKNLSVYDITGEDMPIKSRQHWQRIENGQKNINLTTVFKITKSLEIEACDLFKNLK
jgi:transcriptional regulator with XRE-family HTH domain